MMIRQLSTTIALAVAFTLGLAAAVQGATIVNVGSVDQFTGPGDLNLDAANVVYAINFSNDNDLHTVNGVTFSDDVPNPPGTTLVLPNHVTPWQTKPEFGATADDNALEDVMADIRWASSGSAQVLQADLNVTSGTPYRLQLLISANRSENRIWDIQVEGIDAVDEITSLGISGTTYDVGRSTVYTYEFTAADSQVNVVMGDLFGINDGGDRNPIWQGLVLTDLTPPPLIPEPSSLALLGLGTLGLMRRRRRMP